MEKKMCAEKVENIKNKEELETIASALVGHLKKESLPIWQAKEVLEIASREIDNQTLS